MHYLIIDFIKRRKVKLRKELFKIDEYFEIQ
jgi:hypothetical protein